MTTSFDGQFDDATLAQQQDQGGTSSSSSSSTPSTPSKRRTPRGRRGGVRHNKTRKAVAAAAAATGDPAMQPMQAADHAMWAEHRHMLWSPPYPTPAMTYHSRTAAVGGGSTPTPTPTAAFLPSPGPSPSTGYHQGVDDCNDFDGNVYPSMQLLQMQMQMQMYNNSNYAAADLVPPTQMAGSSSSSSLSSAEPERARKSQDQSGPYWDDGYYDGDDTARGPDSNSGSSTKSDFKMGDAQGMFTSGSSSSASSVRIKPPKVFVSYLPPAFTVDDVAQLFGPFGTIVSIKLLPTPNESLLPLKYRCGFVQFDHPSAVKACIEELHQYHVTTGGKRYILTVRNASDQAPMNTTNLMVKNLPADMTEARLFETFSQFGRVTSVRIIRDRERYALQMQHEQEYSRRPTKGLAFVNFASSENALRAIQSMHNSFMDARRIHVSFAEKEYPYNVHVFDCDPLQPQQQEQQDQQDQQQKRQSYHQQQQARSSEAAPRRLQPFSSSITSAQRRRHASPDLSAYRQPRGSSSDMQQYNRHDQAHERAPIPSAIRPDSNFGGSGAGGGGKSYYPTAAAQHAPQLTDPRHLQWPVPAPHDAGCYDWGYTANGQAALYPSAAAAYAEQGIVGGDSGHGAYDELAWARAYDQMYSPDPAMHQPPYSPTMQHASYIQYPQYPPSTHLPEAVPTSSWAAASGAQTLTTAPLTAAKTVIMVREIPAQATRADLQKTFSRFGLITQLECLASAESDQQVAVIDFGLPANALAAIQEPVFVCGSHVAVSYALGTFAQAVQKLAPIATTQNGSRAPPSTTTSAWPTTLGAGPAVDARARQQRGPVGGNTTSAKAALSIKIPPPSLLSSKAVPMRTSSLSDLWPTDQATAVDGFGSAATAAAGAGALLTPPATGDMVTRGRTLSTSTTGGGTSLSFSPWQSAFFPALSSPTMASGGSLDASDAFGALVASSCAATAAAGNDTAARAPSKFAKAHSIVGKPIVANGGGGADLDLAASLLSLVEQ